MVSSDNLVSRDDREEQIWNHPEPLQVMDHHTKLYGPPGNQAVRRFKIRDMDHWYLFDRSGRAVARIEPIEWTKAVAGV